MPRQRALPPDAEVAIAPKMQPLVLRTDGSIKTLSLAFLADLENDWREHGPEAVARARQQNPTAYVLCVASLAKVMRVEIGRAGEFDRPRDPREVMDRLEQRVGAEGRAMFEKFLREVNRLQEQQEQQQRGLLTSPRLSMVRVNKAS